MNKRTSVGCSEPGVASQSGGVCLIHGGYCSSFLIATRTPNFAGARFLSAGTGELTGVRNQESGVAGVQELQNKIDAIQHFHAMKRIRNEPLSL